MHFQKSDTIFKSALYQNQKFIKIFISEKLNFSKLPNFKYRKFGHLILKNNNQAKRNRLYSPVSFCIRHLYIKIYKLNLCPMYF